MNVPYACTIAFFYELQARTDTCSNAQGLCILANLKLKRLRNERSFMQNIQLHILYDVQTRTNACTHTQGPSQRVIIPSPPNVDISLCTYMHTNVHTYILQTHTDTEVKGTDTKSIMASAKEKMVKTVENTKVCMYVCMYMYNKFHTSIHSDHTHVYIYAYIYSHSFML